MAASTDDRSIGASLATSTRLPPSSPPMIRSAPMTATLAKRVAAVAASARTKPSGG